MINHNVIGKRLSAVVSLFFLLTYISTIFLYPVHKLLHEPPQEVVCYEENNACHLKLVHHDLENGCNHDSHFLEDNFTSCDLCALLQTQPATEVTYPAYSLEEYASELRETLIFEHAFNQEFFRNTDRGPPMNS